ncbi:MAG: selenium-dependent molybdenum cofactor biosynthesis protein YqeB [Anaerolineae bacterium]
MRPYLFPEARVLVRGAGDLATGVAWRLHRAGFPVLMTEIERPLAVRLGAVFATAVFEGSFTVEGVTARRVADLAEAEACIAAGEIPVWVDPEGNARELWRPRALVDAIMAKRNTGTRLADADLVIALGPGFTAGADCHAVVETHRSHWLGRVLWRGAALPDTRTPGRLGGRDAERVLRAPCAGYVIPHRAIGDLVRAGEVVAEIDGQAICAPFDGVLRGLIHPSVQVQAGMKIGDVDPRGLREHCFTISDKSLAVGGGVLEAILSAPQMRPWLVRSCDAAD